MSDLNKSCFIILGLLSKAEHSGYSLKRHMKKTSDFYGSESNAQIYPILKKLESLGLVTSTADIQSGARHKRIFSITTSGMDALKQWLDIDCALDLHREAFLLQLALAQHLSTAQLEKKIAFYKASVIEKLECLKAIIRHIHVDHDNRQDKSFLLMTYDHIQCMLEAKIAWCDNQLTHLANQDTKS